MQKSHWRSTIIAAIIGLYAVCWLTGAAAQTSKGTNPQGDQMKKSFVFIFRQGSRKLSDEEQKRRTEEVRTWALEQIKQGRNLEPRVLSADTFRLGEGADSDSGAPVIALNFIEAADLNEATSIAQTHPGLRYGVTIEVRPWTDPRNAQK